ncbi:divalent-cation tolerance protein CutA [Terasakiella sp. A23]|uniref:divalent-cation tolerance protein CutA n=1 Tax=Terasakiella sp. FCG-A23 TaxID=3080561 RepID=UPI002952C0BD|nr:divalent-cation tolerance protein CutA [Terasakiella sp. A23]MDV7338610.1 divalent-cation tolerance protein CutA [Terasakiella sp. A23]
METVLLYATCANEAEARAIGRTLVQERLVACVNILPTIQSLYWWNDEVQEDTETAFFAKATRENVDRIVTRIKEIHSYDCPAIITTNIENGNEGFLKWITDECRK